jgi:hypothetical protein
MPVFIEDFRPVVELNTRHHNRQIGVRAAF